MKLRSAAWVPCVALVALLGCNSEPERSANAVFVEKQSDTDNSNTTGDMGNGDASTDASSDMPEDMGSDALNNPPNNGIDLGAEDTGGQDMGADLDVCIPETDEEMCARYSYECGPLADLDNCGVMRNIDSCGDEITVCTDPNETCGGGGVPGECGCTIQTCEQLGVLCGQVDDTCGGILDCDLFCVDSIDSGDKHACAIGSGFLKCWGNGGDGALGTGANSTQKNPADVVGLTTTVNEVSAGGHHTCVIDSAQRVQCWGKNDRSQLGIGTTVDSNAPAAPAIAAGADQIEAGDEHNCARSGDKLECWGSNEFGQIGDPAFNINANVGVPAVPFELDAGVHDVSAGDNHTCVIVDDADAGLVRAVKCWGRNRFAQSRPLSPIYNVLHDEVPSTGTWSIWIHDTADMTWDEASRVTTPHTITDAGGAPLQGVKAVSAGTSHTCIIDMNDEIWCWGYMPGFDPDPSCPHPFDKVPRECAVWPGPGFDTTQPGSVGIVVGNGKHPTGTDPASIGTIQGMPVANAPVQVIFDKTPIEISSGDDHVCVRVSDPDPNASNIYCWGNSLFGQVGDGTNNNWTDPRLVITDTDGDFVIATQIDLGGRHSCALVDDSNINCWGSNASSQIGNSNLLRDESYRPFNVLLEP